MNNFDFTSTPVIGNIMSITGIQNGWVVISIFLLILVVIFLAGWIASAKSARTSKRELADLRDEVMGLKALTNLPPLHSDEYGNLGDSLVFASTKELKKRHEEEVDAAARANMARHPNLGIAQDLAPSPMQPQESAPAGDPSVTAQVHEQIYASVTKNRTPIKAKTENAKRSESEDMIGNRKRKANGAAITSSDLPPIVKPDSQTKREFNQQKKKKPASTDASLSGRIPRM